MSAFAGGPARFVAVFALCACAVDPYRLDAPRSAAGVELAPYALHEECFRLDAGERIDFYFVSVAPVAFNVHYHDGNAIVMPVSRDSVSSDAGIFAPRITQGYCLMWEAGGSGAALDYRALVRRVRP